MVQTKLRNIRTGSSFEHRFRSADTVERASLEQHEMEYLYSDEGQLGWLKGYCHPIRFNAMSKAGKIPQDILDKLPPAENYQKAIFPTLEDQDKAKGIITGKGDSVVGANVK